MLAALLAPMQSDISQTVSAFSPRFSCRGGNSYGDWKYNLKEFRHKIKVLARDLTRVAEREEATAIAVSGSSGIYAGAALQLHLDLPIVMVRRDSEVPACHGYDVEGADGLHFSRYLILDDFVSSGATVKHIMAALDPARCVGVVEHQGRGECLVQMDHFSNKALAHLSRWKMEGMVRTYQ